MYNLSFEKYWNPIKVIYLYNIKQIKIIEKYIKLKIKEAK